MAEKGLWWLGQLKPHLQEWKLERQIYLGIKNNEIRWKQFFFSWSTVERKGKILKTNSGLVSIKARWNGKYKSKCGGIAGVLYSQGVVIDSMKCTHKRTLSELTLFWMAVVAKRMWNRNIMFGYLIDESTTGCFRYYIGIKIPLFCKLSMIFFSQLPH